ncbi:Copper resistance protein CopC [Acidisarcina polymorpha]|uniref:Copper resistance protein CopC n=2 Tax=Acidisarcina polymorpha TaxID=2211140 RepID=A0A2Z5G721_9BACT|nr:Copper resistance protein CopC [Acidisarcina polymorpha]
MTAIAVTLITIPRVASAHAVLMRSLPAANSTVHGPDVPVTIQFNSRVDSARSTLLLSMPGGEAKPLVLEKQTAPDTLTTHATQLTPGKYAIRWQVLATDGHITRGQISFAVQ